MRLFDIYFLVGNSNIIENIIELVHFAVSLIEKLYLFIKKACCL